MQRVTLRCRCSRFAPTQPGAENDELIEYIKSMPEELQNKVVYGGPCILVEGAELAKAQGKL